MNGIDTSTSVIVYTTEPAREPETSTESRSSRKELLTIESLENELNNFGYNLRLNILSNTIEYIKNGKVKKFDDVLVAELHSWLKARNYSNVTFDTIGAYALASASYCKYNPVLDLIKSGKWDGTDRLQSIYDLLGVSDQLSKTLIFKWFMQGIALLHNDDDDPYGADGVLVLVGLQGAGKTSFFKQMAIKRKWFAEAQNLNDRDKDTYRRVLTNWISELGEVSKTMKADVDSVKNFITNAYDMYRLPYGRADKENARHTNICATCNEDEYLIDQTGNRRWWTVHTKSYLDMDKVLKIDALQVWRQVYEIWKDGNPQAFRLTRDEQRQLEERNKKALKPEKGEDEVLDILAKAEDKKYKVESVTITQFKEYYPSLRKYTTQQIGRILTKHGCELSRTKSGRFYNLPVPVLGWESEI